MIWAIAPQPRTPTRNGRELLQGQTKPEIIRREAVDLLSSEERVAQMRRTLGELRPRLGAGGASRHAAAEVAPLVPPLARGRFGLDADLESQGEERS